MRPEFHPINGKVELQTEINKIKFDVEKAGGFWLKTTIKKEKQAAKFT